MAVACLCIAGANSLLFKDAAAAAHPFPKLKIVAVISLLWMVAAAWLLCARAMVGRFLVLFILYAGCLGFFLDGIIRLAMLAPKFDELWPFFAATAIYFVVSVVVTHSVHVQRLTSRMWE